MIDQKKLDKLASDLADPWLAGNCNLDTRGLPLNLDAPAEEPSFIDEQFGGLVNESRHSLRAELAKLADDPTALADLARFNPAAAEELQERASLEAAEAFTRANPGYYVCDENARALEAYLAAHDLGYTANNLRTAYDALSAAGKLKSNPTEPRAIPESVRIRIARTAAEDPQEAVSLYLQHRLPAAAASRISHARTAADLQALMS